MEDLISRESNIGLLQLIAIVTLLVIHFALTDENETFSSRVSRVEEMKIKVAREENYSGFTRHVNDRDPV